MTFSIIIPCYNCAESLEITIASINDCGLIDYELLLVDDGSTDGTSELCDILSEKYSEIRCIHQENSGVSAARNLGITEAKGQYIWFVDADDVVEPLNMEEIRQAVRESTDCIMFGMSFLYMRHKKLIRQENLSCDRVIRLTQSNMGQHFRMLFEKNYLSAIWNKLIRRNLLIENKIYFDCELINYEDLHFSLLVLNCCKTMIALPDIAYHYMNTFGHDRTVDRIQRIPDVISYTDRIVEPLYTLNHQLCDENCPPVEGLGEIVLHLYMEAVLFKIKTANAGQIKKICSAAQKNKNIEKERSNISRLSVSEQRVFNWLNNNNYTKLRLFSFYGFVRSLGSRVYRITRSYLRI